MNIKLPESAEKLRGVFSEAIDACGMEFRSDELWSLYIEYEAIHGNLKEAMALYNRILNIPTQRYQMHFERFKILVSSHSPVKFLTGEELNRIHASIQVENDNDQVAAEDLPTGDIADSLTEMDLQKIRQHIIDTRKQMHLLNEIQVNKRTVFEIGIKRLYFFATPLSVKQLRNWRIYLNFEMSEGQHERIVVLFERCLMPCALYEEFWILYARYMERHSIEAARSVFVRACRTHLPLKYTLHLQWALFEEQHGQLDSARAIFCNLQNVLPEVAMVRVRHANFERRIGNLQEAERLLREGIQKSSAPEMAAFYTGKLARLLLKLKKEPEKARDVLIEGLKMVPNSPYLHQCLLETEVSRDAVDDVIHCVERALNSNIHDTVKGILSQRRLEFLEDCGNNIKSLRNAFDEHQKLIKQEELKRKANYKYEEDKKAKTQSFKPPVGDIVIPGVPQPEIPSPAPPLVSKESATVSPAQTTTVNVKTENKPVPYQKPPPVQPRFHQPRPPAQPYFPRQRAPVQNFIPVVFRARISPPMPPPHMGGPPVQFPPYNYEPWQPPNFEEYNRPPPWNFNRLYLPY
ncbi:hypothetical protein GDO78_003767 [Eleutherodactylus coqui]|nr:hypothetical protein GDO78_003767 [Eleutherodactylus coqui]